MPKAKKSQPAKKRPGLFDEMQLPDIYSQDYYVIRNLDDTDNGVISALPGTIEIASFDTLHLSLPTPTSDTPSGLMMTIKCHQGRKHTLSGVFGRMLEAKNTDPYVQRLVFNYQGALILLMNGCDRWLVWAHHDMSVADDPGI